MTAIINYQRKHFRYVHFLVLPQAYTRVAAELGMQLII
jgi:hypothetical protein